MKLLITFLLISTIFCQFSNANDNNISLYYGAFTTHFTNEYQITYHFSDGSTIKTAQKYNNTNHLVAAKYSSVIVGTMVNSYHNRAYFAGYQPEVYSHKKLHIDAGILAVNNYHRGEVGDYLFAFGGDDYSDKVITVLPILSASYELNSTISVQANSMLNVLNAGVRFNF
jgi:hypothetical protein